MSETKDKSLLCVIEAYKSCSPEVQKKVYDIICRVAKTKTLAEGMKVIYPNGEPKGALEPKKKPRKR